MFYIFAIDLHEIPFLLYSAKRSGHRQPKSILVCCLPAGRQQKGTYITLQNPANPKRGIKKQSRNNAFEKKIWNNNSKICNII